MAPQPKRRHSLTRARIRHESIKQSLASLIVCKNCGKKSLSHRICPACGFYNGKSVTIKKAKATIKKHEDKE